MKTIKTAWRNMWRNRSRTIITASAVLFSALVVSLVVGFEEGFVNDMKANIKSDLTGDIRIMNATYVANARLAPLGYSVPDTSQAIEALRANPVVEDATPRTEFGVAVYRSGDRIPCRACGVDFATSRTFSNPATKLLSGSLPAPLSTGVVITAGLADELKLSVGDKFTAIARTATNGSNGKTFRVAGIALLPNTDYANRAFFLDWRVAGDFLRMGDNALSVQVFLKKGVDEDEAVPLIKKTLGSDALDVRAWYNANGVFAFFKMAGFMYAIIASVFYALASTVIFNTTMMSVLERKREIGTLGALGLAPRRIVALFVAESLEISSLGSAAGLLLGFAILGVAGRVGFDVSSMGGNSVSGMGFSQVIFPSLSPDKYLFIFLIGVAVSLVAGLLPARMAARIEPAEALADR
ncbi:MAG TPA: ABC transporter permease [Treponemataceae bacterium]|nr:ABC transporter permease [Treponemataceae bacterium]